VLLHSVLVLQTRATAYFARVYVLLTRECQVFEGRNPKLHPDAPTLVLQL
jgi:hypothetical protein